jgi:hypothetical protein
MIIISHLSSSFKSEREEWNQWAERKRRRNSRIHMISLFRYGIGIICPWMSLFLVDSERKDEDDHIIIIYSLWSL